METDKNNIKLTSAEISELWGTYQNDTLAICMLRYFLTHVEDTEIRGVLQYALEFLQAHIPKLKAFFQEEGNVIPLGFTEQDVNETAPRLFSDTYMILYTQQMAKLGLNAYSVAVASSARQDIHAYYSEGLKENIELHKMANDVLLSKGLYIRPPSIPKQDKVTFVDDKSLIKGWFGKHRPLISIEVTHLFANAQRNSLGVSTLIGFSQVAKSEEVTNFLIRGKEIASKHVEVFSSILREDDLPFTMSGSGVTTSTVPPFSDKLMMAVTTGLIALGIGYYGTSLATSMRTDLATQYTRLTAEIGKYSLDGAKLLIKNGWMEQPPMQADRDKLAKND